MKGKTVETAKAFSSTQTNKSRLMTWALNNGQLCFYSQQKVSSRSEERAALASVVLDSHTYIPSGFILTRVQHQVWLSDENASVCHELECYSSVASGPGEDNVNYSLFKSLECLWQVVGEWLWKQQADSLFSRGLCSLVTYWCSLSIEVTASCYVREQHVQAESHGKQQGYFHFVNTRFKGKNSSRNKHNHVMSMEGKIAKIVFTFRTKWWTEALTQSSGGEAFCI